MFTSTVRSVTTTLPGHAPSMSSWRLNTFELGLGEGHFDSVHRNRLRVLTHRETFIRNAVGLGRSSRSCEHSLDACEHLAHRERLGDVVVGTGGKPLKHIVLGVFCCEEDDGQRGASLLSFLSSQFFSKLEARPAGHHHVEQQQVEGRGRDVFECFFCRVGRLDTISGCSQVEV